jgi:hypothetical protein
VLWVAAIVFVVAATGPWMWFGRAVAPGWTLMAWVASALACVSAWTAGAVIARAIARSVTFARFYVVGFSCLLLGVVFACVCAGIASVAGTLDAMSLFFMVMASAAYVAAQEGAWLGQARRAAVGTRGGGA